MYLPFLYVKNTSKLIHASSFINYYDISPSNFIVVLNIFVKYNKHCNKLITTLYVRVSINETRSSLFPTAMVLPFGDQAMLIFSPFVAIVAAHL